MNVRFHHEAFIILAVGFGIVVAFILIVNHLSPCTDCGGTQSAAPVQQQPVHPMALSMPGFVDDSGMLLPNATRQQHRIWTAYMEQLAGVA